MKIISRRVYTGRNIYSHKLCIRLTVDVEEMCEVPTRDIENFNVRLLKELPGLKNHKCSLGYVGGFVERLAEGTYLPHVFEHMIIEMQNVLGFTGVKYGKARHITDRLYYIIYQYELSEAGILCAEHALECINSFIKGQDYDMKGALSSIEKKIADVRLGPSTRSIYDEAVKREIPVIRIGKQSMLQLGYGRRQRRIEATLTDLTSSIAVDISCNKAVTKEILSSACIPVAKGNSAYNADEALNISKKIGYPVVIKPVDGSHGSGVTVGISDDDGVLSAYNEAAKYNTTVIVEKYIEGNDYRVLVINGKAAAASMRIPPSVTGDGKHSINELIGIENENPERGYGHEKILTKISIDNVMLSCLKEKGLNIDYIPLPGETVILRRNANLSTGGTAKDCTDMIHPDNIECAVRSAEAVGLDVAGIDICTKDISKSIITEEGAVLEVNAAPGIRMHMYPTAGKVRNAASRIIDYLFPDSSKCSIPVISITGTNGKTTTTRMIGHIFSMKGLFVGMTTTSGIYMDNKRIIKGDTTGPDSAETVLMDKRVDVAVLETARGGILRRGLGYDLADVGVITNITEDHLGIDGIETLDDLIDVKSLVVEAVKNTGFAVLNADDVSVNILKQKCRSSIIYFSKNPESIIIKKHILDGGYAVFVKSDYMYFSDGEKTQPVVDIRDIPSALEGKLDYNVENAMAAAAACIALGVDVETISKGLKTFFLDSDQNPGRFNIYNFESFRVIIDYGHNPCAFEAVINGMKKMNAKRLVGVIGVPGDRKNECIIQSGYVCGCGFDYLYIKEDMDKRGRKDGEVAALLENGALNAGKVKTDYKIILNEGDALKHAMDNAQDGDLIAAFYEDYGTIMRSIEMYNHKAEIKANAV
jgi:cyanophycin synthetase